MKTIIHRLFSKIVVSCEKWPLYNSHSVVLWSEETTNISPVSLFYP